MFSSSQVWVVEVLDAHVHLSWMTLTSASSTTCACMETFTIKFSICFMEAFVCISCWGPSMKDTIKSQRGLLLNKVWILHQWTKKNSTCKDMNSVLRAWVYRISWKGRVTFSDQASKIKKKSRCKQNEQKLTLGRTHLRGFFSPKTKY